MRQHEDDLLGTLLAKAAKPHTHSLVRCAATSQKVDVSLPPPSSMVKVLPISIFEPMFREHWTFPWTVGELGLKGMEEENPMAWL